MKEKLKNLKGRLGKWFWVILIVVLFIGWRVIASINKTADVAIANVTQGEVVEAVSTSGTIKADNYANLTFQTSGKVSAVYVKEGDHVKKGAFLAKLDTVPLNAAYQEALNTYRKYQATAENILDQVKDHSSDETYSQKDTRTTAEVNRDNAYNAVLAAEDNLKNATITAPFSGVVAGANPVFAGSNVGPTTSGYVVVDPSTVYFDSEVEETDLPKIKLGQKVEIRLDAYPDQTFNGTVTNIGFVAFTSSTGGNAYSVRISLPENSDMRFRYGMQGDVDIIYNTVSDVAKIPSLSIVSSGGADYVWKVERGRVKKVEITEGAMSTDEVEIKSGLSVGDKLVINPATNLKDGEKVNIIN